MDLVLFARPQQYLESSSAFGDSKFDYWFNEKTFVHYHPMFAHGKENAESGSLRSLQNHLNHFKNTKS